MIIQSFTNTAIDKFKAKQNEVNKISERILQSKKGLVSMQESFNKEKEAEDIKNNMFTKIPLYKDQKSGYL